MDVTTRPSRASAASDREGVRPGRPGHGGGSAHGGGAGHGGRRTPKTVAPGDRSGQAVACRSDVFVMEAATTPLPPCHRARQRRRRRRADADRPRSVELVRAGWTPARIPRRSCPTPWCRRARARPRARASQADFVRGGVREGLAEVEASFADRARTVAEVFDHRVEEVSAPSTGTSPWSSAAFGEDRAPPSSTSSVRDDGGLGRMRKDRPPVLLRGRRQPAGRLQGRRGARHPRAARPPGHRHARAGDPRRGAARRRSSSSRPRRPPRSRSPPSTRARPPRAAYEVAVADAWTRRVARGDDCDAVGDVRGTGGGRATCWSGRRLRRPRPRPHRLRGEELPPLAQRGAGGARRGDGPARGPTTPCGWCRPMTCCCARPPAARGQRREALRRLRTGGRARGSALEVGYALAAPAR